jgi:hypothetical protein
MKQNGKERKQKTRTEKKGASEAEQGAYREEIGNALDGGVLRGDNVRWLEHCEVTRLLLHWLKGPTREPHFETDK